MASASGQHFPALIHRKRHRLTKEKPPTGVGVEAVVVVVVIKH